MQYACAILPSVACPTLQYFIPHYLINITISETKGTEHKICVLILCTTFVWNISHSLNNWKRYDQKCLLILLWSARCSCPILIKLNFVDGFFPPKNYPIPNFVKIRLVEAELCPFRHMDMSKLAVTFCSFAKVPNDGLQLIRKNAAVTHCRYHRSGNANELWKETLTFRSLTSTVVDVPHR